MKIEDGAAAEMPGNGGPAMGPPVSDADFRLMVDAIGDYAIFLLDTEGRVRTWNTGAQRFKGYRPEEIIGQHIRVFYPQEVQDARWPEYELDAARQDGRFEDEGWRIRKDGSRFWANIILTHLVDAQGNSRGFSKITRDLTERRRAEEALRSSEERFRLLVEGVEEYAIFLLDTDGRIASWNAGAQRNKGYLPSEVIGRHFSIFYPPEIAASDWPNEELRRAVADGRFEDEGWRIRKDGSRFWASVIITPLYDESRTHRGFAKVTRDLTPQRQIHRLEDEGRRITTFLAMLGHELRNPLAPIANALVMMEMADPASDQVRTARAVIARQLTQMTRLVDDLLDVGRITSGKIHLDCKPTRLAELVEEAMEAIEPAARARGHALAAGVIDGTLWAEIDRARIIQVIGNLLANAVKFTAPGGDIQVSLYLREGFAEISVKDNGPGVAEDMLSEIFKPFVQGEQDAARSLGGLGLGLSLVQQIVELHGGHVSAFSGKNFSRGSEFVIALPPVAPPADLPVAPGSRAAHGRGRILVVDDNHDAADTLQVVLAALGFTATVAYNGRSALDLVRRDRPDLVLLDLGLPDIDGLEIASRLRAGLEAPPKLVALTGYGGDDDRAACATAGFDAHLTKPADIGAISAVLDRLLA